jgi:replicative DNA helicase
MNIPHNIEAEEAVIASLLIDGEAVEKLNLKPDDFYDNKDTNENKLTEPPLDYYVTKNR